MIACTHCGQWIDKCQCAAGARVSVNRSEDPPSPQVSKERREELRLELSEGAPGMGEVSLMPDELRALLDMADEYERAENDLHKIALVLSERGLSHCTSEKELGEHLDWIHGQRDRYRDLLGEVLEYFDQRADADCEGDPLRYVPNEEMRWKDRIETALNGRQGDG